MEVGMFGFPQHPVGFILPLLSKGWKEKLYIANGKFKLPFSAVLLLFGCGGGGGGGGSNSVSNYGGSGGGAASLFLPIYSLILPAGVALDIVIGPGGAGGDLTANGSNGGSTTFSVGGFTFLSVTGGNGGLSFTNGATGGTTTSLNGILMPGTNGQSAGPQGGYAAITRMSRQFVLSKISFGAPGQAAKQSATQFGAGGSASDGTGVAGSGKNGFAQVLFRAMDFKTDF